MQQRFLTCSIYLPMSYISERAVWDNILRKQILIIRIDSSKYWGNIDLSKWISVNVNRDRYCWISVFYKKWKITQSFTFCILLIINGLGVYWKTFWKTGFSCSSASHLYICLALKDWEGYTPESYIMKTFYADNHTWTEQYIR